MSRDSNGSYTLPLPSVISGTVIASTWANTTMNDLEIALTDSLSKSGKGSMTAQLKGFPGSKLAPGYSFSSSTNSGFYLETSTDLRLAVNGIDAMRFLSNDVQVWNDTNSTWTSVLTGTIYPSVERGITAGAGGGTGNAYILSGEVVIEVSTVATSGDSIMLRNLPTSQINAHECFIINNGANPMDVFPNSGDDLGMGVNTARSLLAGHVAYYISYDNSTWVLVSDRPVTIDLTAAYAWTGAHTFTVRPTVNSNVVYDAGNINEAVLGINAQTGTSYTTVLGDAGGLTTMDNAAANTLTIPPNSSVAYPVGTVLTIRQKGAGQTTIAEGAGVTISVAASKGLLISEQHEWASLVKEGTDAWSIAGGLTA